jgi:predicted esterase
MRSVFFFLVFISASAEAVETQDIQCLGSPRAKHFVVYLHGLDAKELSHQEVANRKILEQIAKKLDLRIALPRAQDKCSNVICWGWALTNEKAKESIPLIKASAKSCFASGTQFGLIGFSSGGYLATKLFRSCMLPSFLPEVNWIVTSGSAMMNGPIEPLPENLEKCGAITMLVGTKDKSNLDPSKNYLHQLEAKKAHIKYVEFEGDHNLFEVPLLQAVEQYLK